MGKRKRSILQFAWDQVVGTFFWIITPRMSWAEFRNPPPELEDGGPIEIPPDWPHGYLLPVYPTPAPLLLPPYLPKPTRWERFCAWVTRKPLIDHDELVREFERQGLE